MSVAVEVEQPLFDVDPDKIVPRPRVFVGQRAFYRSFGIDRRDIVYLHVLRDRPVRRRVTDLDWKRGPDHPEGWCGITARSTTRSPAVYLDPLPAVPPDGLQWCPTCLGHLAKRLDRLTEIGQLLAEFTQDGA